MDSALANVGRTTSYIFAIVVSIFSAIAIAFSIYYIFIVKTPCDGFGCHEDYKTYGGIIIAGALFFTGFAWMIYYFDSKSKTLAAIDGGSDIINAVSSIFK